MNRLLKKYWKSKTIFLLIIFGLSLMKANAQSSFFLEINQECCGYALDIFEDEKGCIIANYDYGITRVNPNGRILWQTRDFSIFKGAIIRDSQSYIFAQLGSEVGGFAITSIDYRGNILWSVFEDQSSRLLRTYSDFIIDSARKLYIVAGEKMKIGDYKNMSYWIAGVDYHGKVVWENFWRDSGKSSSFKRIFKNQKTKGYFLLGWDEIYQFANELINVDSLGRLINRNPLEPNPCTINAPSSSDYTLRDITSFDDTMFIASIEARTSCPDPYGTYFYLYNNQGKLIKRIYSQDANGVMSQTRDNGLITGVGIYIAKLNKNFERKWAKNILPDEEFEAIYIKKIGQSKDGGYYGIAGGYRAINGNWSNTQYLVYIFKTDSLGNINPTHEYSEKQQPVMLQPNPASNKVRIAIPYYFGKVTAEFYTMQGVFLFQKANDEQYMFDISSLLPGMYIVKARLEETGEMRTMKLIVQ